MNAPLFKSIFLVATLVLMGLGLGFGKPVHAASQAVTFCKSVTAYNTSAEQTACEYGYDNSNKDWQTLCANRYKPKTSLLYGTCAGGAAAGITQKPVAPVVTAQSNACTPDQPDNCDFIRQYVNPGINLLSIAFGLIAVISIILGSLQYSSAGGDPQKVTQAKQRISKTIIAIIAYLFLYAFLQFIVPGGIFK